MSSSTPTSSRASPSCRLRNAKYEVHRTRRGLTTIPRLWFRAHLQPSSSLLSLSPAKDDLADDLLSKLRGDSLPHAPRLSVSCLCMPSSRARSDSTSGSSRYDTSSDSSGYSDEEDRSQRSGVRRGRRAAPSRSARGYRSLSKSQQGVEDAGSEISSSEEEKGELQARGPPKPRSNAPLILGAAIVLALLTLSGMALISYSFNKGESQATTRSSPSVASQAAASSPSSPSSARTTSPSSRSLASPASTAAFTSSAPSKTSSSAPSASSTSDNGYTALVAFGASYT